MTGKKIRSLTWNSFIGQFFSSSSMGGDWLEGVERGVNIVNLARCEFYLIREREYLVLHP